MVLEIFKAFLNGMHSVICHERQPRDTQYIMCLCHYWCLIFIVLDCSACCFNSLFSSVNHATTACKRILHLLQQNLKRKWKTGIDLTGQHYYFILFPFHDSSKAQSLQGSKILSRKSLLKCKILQRLAIHMLLLRYAPPRRPFLRKIHCEFF